MANPLAGKDVRRLTAKAAVTPMDHKRASVARVVLAAAEVGVERVVLLPSPFRVSERAAEEVAHRVGAEIVFADVTVRGGRTDTAAAVAAMRRDGVGAVVALGGDGTCRDVALAWPDAPLLTLSTGTNNSFPEMREATVVGAAAGLVATGAVPVDEVSVRPPVVRLRVDDADDDLALVDAVVTAEHLVGWRDLPDPDDLRLVVTARARPASVGFGAVAGLLAPGGTDAGGGVVVRLGPAADAPRRVRVPVAPGRYDTIGVHGVEIVEAGVEVGIDVDGVLACDGERQRRIHRRVVARVVPDGPRVIDVDAVLDRAARAGAFG